MYTIVETIEKNVLLGLYLVAQCGPHILSQSVFCVSRYPLRYSQINVGLFLQLS